MLINFGGGRSFENEPIRINEVVQIRKCIELLRVVREFKGIIEIRINMKIRIEFERIVLLWIKVNLKVIKDEKLVQIAYSREISELSCLTYQCGSLE